jgi:arginyl-tRNA synthetase
MKEIEEIQSLVNLIRSVGDIDKEDFDRIINATKSIEPIIKQLESENEKAYGIINNYLDMIVKGNQQFDKLYGLINKLRAENESLTKKMIDVLEFIDTLRQSDRYIESIYLQGGCYQFYKILKSLFPTASPYFNSKKDHVVTKIDDIYYDIRGIYEGEVIPVKQEDLQELEGWSFSRTMALSLGECRHCEEPLLIPVDLCHIKRRINK